MGSRAGLPLLCCCSSMQAFGMAAGRQARAVVRDAMRTPAWKRFLAEWGTAAIVLALVAGLLLAAYYVLRGG